MTFLSERLEELSALPQRHPALFVLLLFLSAAIVWAYRSERRGG